MGIHAYCDFDCGATDCDAPERQYTATDKSDCIVYISDRGIEYKTVKEAAIDDIKHQPFYA
ncbi:MAG: hypothetical protein GY750_17060 [Lentisphaerae bacterium]|nr:hypothetical protein [Lentisphaerota bacterium]